MSRRSPADNDITKEEVVEGIFGLSAIEESSELYARGDLVGVGGTLIVRLGVRGPTLPPGPRRRTSSLGYY